MDCSKIITATGSGFWGNVYTVELFTVIRNYKSRFGHASREITTYGFRYKPPSATTWELDKVDNSERHFKSETERASFFAHNFTDLKFDPAPAPAILLPCQYDLSLITGKWVYSITFLVDWLQMTIEEHFFDFHVWPTVQVSNTRYSVNETGYRDALCSLIGKVVTHVDEYYDVGLIFDFEDSNVLEVPLRASHDIILPEIAEYHGPDNAGYIWQIGELPYR